MTTGDQGAVVSKTILDALGPIGPLLGPLVAAVATGFLAPYVMERMKRIYDLQLKREEAKAKTQGVADQSRADDQTWFRTQVTALRAELVEQEKRHDEKIAQVNAKVDEWRTKYYDLWEKHVDLKVQLANLKVQLARLEGEKGDPTSPTPGTL